MLETEVTICSLIKDLSITLFIKDNKFCIIMFGKNISKCLNVKES